VHFDLDVRDQRLSAYDARGGERDLATGHVHGAAVLVEVFVELIFVVDDHFAMATYGTRRHLRKHN